MFEVIPPAELPKVIEASQTGRCVACYADAFGNGFYCPSCDPPIQEIADLMEYGAPLQLTTGSLFHHWDWVESCTCDYGLHPTIWCSTHLIDVPGVGQRGAAYTFRVSRYCPHHGDARRSGPYLIEGGGLYEYVLDEDERRGH